MSIPFPYLLASLGVAMSFSFGPVIIKFLGATRPAPINAVAMASGALILLVLSRIIGEPIAVPQSPAVWAAFVHLILAGSVGLFVLMFFLLERWPASVVAYTTPISPIVAIVLSAALLDEPLTGGLFLGAALVAFGVYLGTKLQLRATD